tara:strand:+ start:931 stop:1284 length:354 start_codon:yes stop_codon:yes gene_type:complete
MKYDNLSKPLGVNEIAILLKVKPDTVSSWQLRKIFPKPDAYINDMKTRVWKLQTVFDWARSTGRNNRNFTNYGDAGSFLEQHAVSSIQSARHETLSNIDNTVQIDANIGSYDDSKLK